MMQIVATERFRKSQKVLPKAQKEKLKKQFEFFMKDMWHPSLHTEKLEPRYKNIWSFRIDQKYRVLFTFVPRDNELWLLNVGPHDIYKKGQ